MQASFIGFIEDKIKLKTEEIINIECTAVIRFVDNGYEFEMQGIDDMEILNSKTREQLTDLVKFNYPQTYSRICKNLLESI